MQIDYPERLDRLTSFFRLIWIIPIAIVLALLSACAVVVAIIAWFTVLLTGRYPRGPFDYVVGGGRWSLRV